MDGSTPETSPQIQGKLDISIVSNPEGRTFASAWSTQRDLNTQFYQSVSNEQFGLRVTEGSPSTRDNLVYQIKVHDNYLKGVREGALVHGKHYGELDLVGKSKDELLGMLEEIDKGIIELVASEERGKMVTVTWSETPVTALAALWGFKDHEIYHLGRNALMGEVLGIPRSEELSRVWG